MLGHTLQTTFLELCLRVPNVKDIMCDWMKWEPITLPTQSRAVNINQYRLPGDYDEFTEIIKELKEVEMICSA